jgi:hypothetical protein
MKNLLKIGFFLLLIMVTIPSNSMNVSSNATVNSTPLDKSEANRMTNRLNEIESIDKSNLSRPEKRELRREVKAIKKTMDSSGGVYISVGALILIVVLLIILL